jgi:ribosomal protein S6
VASVQVRGTFIITASIISLCGKSHLNQFMNENDNLIYEIGYHILPNIDESQVPVQSLKIKSIVEENEGVIISEGMPKMVILSYDISKTIDSKKQRFNKAYFGWVKFEADPSQISNIKSKIESLADVLRFIIVKTVKEDTMHTPKIPMFKKENSNKEEKGTEHVEKVKASEEEIDKSIDQLIVG